MKRTLEITLVLLVAIQMLGTQRHMIGCAATTWCGIQITAGKNQ